MAAAQPIKDTESIEALKNYFLLKKANHRNYALFVTGINTALRIGDILSLKWDDVYNFDNNQFKNHIVVKEQKTGKKNTVAMNQNVIDSLEMYRNSLPNIKSSQYVFTGRDKKKALSRSQAFRIIKNACKELRLPDNISCHSLRKTFGYHAWTAGTDPVLLMFIFNHSDFQITRRYLGIDQNDKDNVFLHLNL